jgi:sugar (pentulose or hexulose) kinase
MERRIILGNYYLAVNLEKTAGHHIFGYLEDGRIITEEIYSFPNKLYEKDGEQCWDFEQLFKEVECGLIKCRERDKLPIYVGVDAWEHDFVLLDDTDKILGNPATDQSAVDRLINIRDKHPDILKRRQVCF